MTDLPVCRLCKQAPRKWLHMSVVENRVECKTPSCKLFYFAMTESDWRKLMYVPAKIADDCVGDELFRRRNEGYNAAIDDMLRGGANG